jgi:hypothetical protein
MAGWRYIYVGKSPIIKTGTLAEWLTRCPAIHISESQAFPSGASVRITQVSIFLLLFCIYLMCIIVYDALRSFVLARLELVWRLIRGCGVDVVGGLVEVMRVLVAKLYAPL